MIQPHIIVLREVTNLHISSNFEASRNQISWIIKMNVMINL